VKMRGRPRPSRLPPPHLRLTRGMANRGDETALEVLRRLVAAPSPNPPGDERAVAEVIRSTATQLGLPRPATLASESSRPNLLFEIGGGSPRLMLVCHMDTMPVGESEAWHTDPFSLLHEGQRLIGLGAADMKAAIAAVLVAAARVAEEGEIAGCLALLFTADEEAGSSHGMRWLASQGLLAADAAAVLEPSGSGEESWQRLYVAQLGSCVCRLEARGEPGHSGEMVPAARRASATFGRALTALGEAALFAEWSHPVDGSRPVVNVATEVWGGATPFAHPRALYATVEVRTIEGMSEQYVLKELRRALSSVDGHERLSLEHVAWIPPGDTANDSHLLDSARRSWRTVVDNEPRLGVLRAGTDAAYLSELGIPALPAFGPGSLGIAHRPNEWLPAADLSRAVELYGTFIRQYLSPHP